MILLNCACFFFVFFFCRVSSLRSLTCGVITTAWASVKWRRMPAKVLPLSRTWSWMYVHLPRHAMYFLCLHVFTCQVLKSFRALQVFFGSEGMRKLRCVVEPFVLLYWNPRCAKYFQYKRLGVVCCVFLQGALQLKDSFFSPRLVMTVPLSESVSGCRLCVLPVHESCMCFY